MMTNDDDDYQTHHLIRTGTRVIDEDAIAVQTPVVFQTRYQSTNFFTLMVTGTPHADNVVHLHHSMPTVIIKTGLIYLVGKEINANSRLVIVSAAGSNLTAPSTTATTRPTEGVIIEALDATRTRVYYRPLTPPEGEPVPAGILLTLRTAAAPTLPLTVRSYVDITKPAFGSPTFGTVQLPANNDAEATQTITDVGAASTAANLQFE